MSWFTELIGWNQVGYRLMFFKIPVRIPEFNKYDVTTGRGGNLKGDGAEVASLALLKNINKHGSDSDFGDNINKSRNRFVSMKTTCHSYRWGANRVCKETCQHKRHVDWRKWHSWTRVGKWRAMAYRNAGRRGVWFLVNRCGFQVLFQEFSYSRKLLLRTRWSVDSKVLAASKFLILATLVFFFFEEKICVFSY